MSQQEQIYDTTYVLYCVVVKDRTKDNYDLVRTFNQFCGVEKNVMPLFRVVLKMTLPKRYGNRMYLSKH